jgi:hypothetical protein
MQTPLLGCMAWKTGSPADNGGFLQRFYTENGSLFVILRNLGFADSFSTVKKHDFFEIYFVYEHLCVILIISVLLLYRKQEIAKDNGAEIFYRGFYEKQESIMDIRGSGDRMLTVVCRVRRDDGNAGVWKCGGEGPKSPGWRR